MLDLYSQNLSLTAVHIVRTTISIRRYVEGIEVLDEQVVCQNGPFVRIKRWIRGTHPELGTIVQGLTGWETLIEIDVLRPRHTFTIVNCFTSCLNAS